jgi:hypothetical protein
MQRCVIWYKVTNISEMLTASMIRGDEPGDRSESTIETWVSFYQITWYIAEYFFVSRRENMKSHLSSGDNIWRKKTK